MEHSLISRDLEYIWHPCTQMKDFEKYPPLIVHKAQGSYIYTNEGPLIDGISSWWCKSLGHQQPDIVHAIKEQLSKFEHVIGANTTYEDIGNLGELLSQITKLKHTFFASDGSSGVEIAMKLCLHAKQIQGFKDCKKFIALKNAYHGETLATLSVSDLGLYKKPYEGLGVITSFLKNIPYVSSIEDPLWADCSPIWDDVLQELESYASSTCALIIEPIIQGAGGMLCYSKDFLIRLRKWTLEKNIYLIADEIMTGLGRTGQWLAVDHANITPDIVCLSKGLTSGFLPLSAVVVSPQIYNIFYADYEEGKSFLHSHTYSGNPLAVVAALATIKTMQKIDINQKVKVLSEFMLEAFLDIAQKTGKILNIRSIGAVVAGELIPNKIPRIGYKFAYEARKRGALLRPLGNTLYWLPPLTMTKEDVAKLAQITLDSLKAVYNH